MFQYIDPDSCFTSDVIRDYKRFVGRKEIIKDCINALNSSLGVLAIYGKRGVGKSSLMRQVQFMANGQYDLVRKAGLFHLLPERKRRYYTVYYSCDSMISNSSELIERLCNDTDPEDGLLRLVPDQGKSLAEFSRTNEASGGLDLKVVQWGLKGQEAAKYTSSVPGNLIQTFRNFVTSVIDANNRHFSPRDSVLILLDEFDVIRDKSGLGSLIKSLSSNTVRFGVCGIGQDIGDLITDHLSVARLVEQGAIHVTPMSVEETHDIFTTATALSDEILQFKDEVIQKIALFSEGYPYFAQLIGKSCVESANSAGTNIVDDTVLDNVLDRIRTGHAFPNLEARYRRAVGNSPDRAILLTLLAEQTQETTEYDANIGRVVLKNSRSTAQGLGVEYVDQLLPRLIDENYGPVLVKLPDSRGLYEFNDPVFRAYVRLRRV